MTEEIYQTIKSKLEEARGDRYERIAREIGGATPHLLVNYEGGQERVEVVLKKEKERHERITAALEWLEKEMKDAKKGVEPEHDIKQHKGDGPSGSSPKTSGSGSAIHSKEV